MFIEHFTYIAVIKNCVILNVTGRYDMKRFDELKDLIMSLEGDFQKFYDKENQAAGTRVRKGMQELKNLSQEIRVEVQGIKNK